MLNFRLEITVLSIYNWIFHTSHQPNPCQRTGITIGVCFGRLVNFSKPFRTRKRLSFTKITATFVFGGLGGNSCSRIAQTSKFVAFSGKKSTRSAPKTKSICWKFSLENFLLYFVLQTFWSSCANTGKKISLHFATFLSDLFITASVPLIFSSY